MKISKAIFSSRASRALIIQKIILKTIDKIIFRMKRDIEVSW